MKTRILVVSIILCLGFAMKGFSANAQIDFNTKLVNNSTYDISVFFDKASGMTVKGTPAQSIIIKAGGSATLNIIGLTSTTKEAYAQFQVAVMAGGKPLEIYYAKIGTEYPSVSISGALSYELLARDKFDVVCSFIPKDSSKYISGKVTDLDFNSDMGEITGNSTLTIVSTHRI